jgi:chromosome segregation ATPase
MALSRDKSVKLAQLYSRVDWLERYSASMGLRLNEATTQMGRMEVRAYDLERELARATTVHNVQRAVTEQRAREAELQVAALREQVEALTAQHQQQEELLEARTVSLTQANALAEGRGEAILRMETALQATQVEIDQGRKRVEGMYGDLIQFTWLCRDSSFVSTQSYGRRWRRRPQ